LQAENKEIAANFRLRKYPEGWYATVRFILKDQVCNYLPLIPMHDWTEIRMVGFQADSTDLLIEASGVPEECAEETRMGLTRYYFQSIGCTFGCAMKMF